MKFKILFNLAVIVGVYFGVFYKKWKDESPKELIFDTVMYIYFSLVLYVTVMPWTGALFTI